MNDLHIILIGRSAVHLASWQQGQGGSDPVLHSAACDAPPYVSENADMGDVVDAIARLVGEHHPAGIQSRLVVPMRWCMTHDVGLGQQRLKDQAVAYEFERYITVDLERIVCACQRLGRDRARVVGVLTTPFARLLDGLEAQGIEIDSLVIDGLLLGHLAPREGAAGAALLDGDHLTLALIDNGTAVPGGLRHCQLSDALGEEALASHVRSTVAAADCPPAAWRLLVAGESDDATIETARAGLATFCDKTEVVQQHDALSAVFESAATEDDPIDLRKDQLAYKGRWAPLTSRVMRCGAAVCFLMLALIVRSRLSTADREHVVTELRQTEQRIYQEAFPGQPLPVAPALRLRSERIKLQGLTEDVTMRDASLAPGREPLERLMRLTEKMPQQTRLFITELVVDQSGVKLAGQTTGHEEAGKLVQALNHVQDLQVAPPRTKLRKDGTVDFRIKAEVFQDGARKTGDN